MKIYVVTEGDYSDYHIVGVCTSKESAERIRQLASGDFHEAQIEEYEADKYNIDATYNCYVVRLCQGGSVLVYEDIGNSFAPYDVWGHNYKNTKDSIYGVKVYAQDEAHAKKIALDCIAEYKAKEEGLV